MKTQGRAYKAKRLSARVKRDGIWFLSGIAILFVMSGCASIQLFSGPQEAADLAAREKGFHRMTIPTTSFPLAAYVRITRPGEPLAIYVEGDGAAWLSRTWQSDDPTPRKPFVLILASMDPAPNVAYLARPGQYPAPDAPPCNPAYWSSRRFAPEVADAMNEAVEALRKEAKAGKIHMVGYSGGAALAVLVASQRTDVASLRTIAGNLDPDTLNRHHNISPLKGSLNPMNAAVSLRNLPRRHFAGEDDNVVPLFIARSFAKQAGDPDNRTVTVVPGAAHEQGWLEKWPVLLALPLQ